MAAISALAPVGADDGRGKADALSHRRRELLKPAMQATYARALTNPRRGQQSGCLEATCLKSLGNVRWQRSKLTS